MQQLLAILFAPSIVAILSIAAVQGWNELKKQA